MKILTGIITSTKMNKTATVSVTRFVTHPIYQKRMRRTVKFQVHDEAAHKVGETVNFVACKPVSKLKKWRIFEPVQPKKESKPKKESVKKNKKV